MKALSIIIAAGLTACGGIQDHAGINHAVVDFHTDGRPKRVEIVGGKEADLIDASFQKGEVQIQYHVRNQRAFEAHRVRGEIEKLLIEQTGNAAPGLVDMIVKIAMP